HQYHHSFPTRRSSDLFALRMTGSTWAAEEIVQDVFMMLMRDPRKYDATRGTFGGFLYGVTRNRVLKHLERLPREVPLEEQHDNRSEEHTSELQSRFDL